MICVPGADGDASNIFLIRTGAVCDPLWTTGFSMQKFGLFQVEKFQHCTGAAQFERSIKAAAHFLSAFRSSSQFETLNVLQRCAGTELCLLRNAERV